MQHRAFAAEAKNKVGSGVGSYSILQKPTYSQAVGVKELIDTCERFSVQLPTFSRIPCARELSYERKKQLFPFRTCREVERAWERWRSEETIIVHDECCFYW